MSLMAWLDFLAILPYFVLLCTEVRVFVVLALFKVTFLDHDRGFEVL